MNGGRDVAAYRIEAYLRNGPGVPPVPWLVSNPIYAGYTRVRASQRRRRHRRRAFPRDPPRPPWNSAAATRACSARLPADPLARRVTDAAPLSWTFALGPGMPRGQFAAVQVPINGGLAAFDRVRFTRHRPNRCAHGSSYARPSATPSDGGRRSMLMRRRGLIDLPLRSFLPIGVTSSEQPPLDRVDSLLFVVDTMNFLPGASGSMLLSDIAFVR